MIGRTVLYEIISKHSMQGTACCKEGLVALSSSLCTHCCRLRQSKKLPFVSATKACELNKPYVLKLMLKESLSSREPTNNLLFGLLPNMEKKIREMNVRHGLYDKIYRACLILPFREATNSPCWSAVNLSLLAQKPTNTNNRLRALPPVGSCWKAWRRRARC